MSSSKKAFFDIQCHNPLSCFRLGHHTLHSLKIIVPNPNILKKYLQAGNLDVSKCIEENSQKLRTIKHQGIQECFHIYDLYNCNQKAQIHINCHKFNSGRKIMCELCTSKLASIKVPKLHYLSRVRNSLLSNNRQ